MTNWTSLLWIAVKTLSPLQSSILMWTGFWILQVQILHLSPAHAVRHQLMVYNVLVELYCGLNRSYVSWTNWPILSSLSFAIRFNLLHPQPSLFLFSLLLPLWCFSTLVNCYFELFKFAFSFEILYTCFIPKANLNLSYKEVLNWVSWNQNQSKYNDQSQQTTYVNNRTNQ